MSAPEQPTSRRLRPGVELLAEEPGRGARIERQKVYRLRLRMWLRRGDPVVWSRPSGLVDRAALEDEGRTMLSDLRFDREDLFAGLFQGIEGMRIGGMRRLRIAPHLAYGERGVPGSIPANALLTVEVSVLEERDPLQRFS